MKLRKIGKKLVSTALVAALGMSLTACGSSSSDGEKTGNEGGKLIIGGTIYFEWNLCPCGTKHTEGSKSRGRIHQ